IEPDGVLWYFAGGKIHRIANPQALRFTANPAQLRYSQLSELRALSENVYAVLRDRGANLWLGTADGLIRLVRSSFHVVEVGKGLVGFALSSSTDDSIVWAQTAASASNVVHFQNGRIDWQVPASAELTERQPQRGLCPEAMDSRRTFVYRSH